MFYLQGKNEILLTPSINYTGFHVKSSFNKIIQNISFQCCSVVHVLVNRSFNFSHFGNNVLILLKNVLFKLVYIYIYMFELLYFFQVRGGELHPGEVLSGPSTGIFFLNLI